jgi:hypothetical protein
LWHYDKTNEQGAISHPVLLTIKVSSAFMLGLFYAIINTIMIAKFIPANMGEYKLLGQTEIIFSMV